MSDFKDKCTKFNFGWGSAPDPAGEAYSAPPDPLAALRGLTYKGRGGDETSRPLSHISGDGPVSLANNEVDLGQGSFQGGACERRSRR